MNKPREITTTSRTHSTIEPAITYKPAAMRINRRDVLFFFGGIVLSSLVRQLSFPVVQMEFANTIRSSPIVRTGAANTTPASIVETGAANTSSPQSTEIQHVERVVQPRFHNPFHIIKSIIPEELQNAYAPDKLLYNLTEGMLEQSRPIRGNTRRLHNYIQKLRRKECTSVVFAGGSVTSGHNAGGPKIAFPRHFMDWLNARYPCQDAEGNPGVHEKVIQVPGNSQTNFVNWSLLAQREHIDLIFLETNINDSFIKGIPHALEEKGDVENFPGSWYFEVIIRRLLLLRKPDPIAIVTFNAGKYYIGRSWATFPPWHDPYAARKMIFRSSREPLVNWISAMYEIPVFSASVWMLPLAGRGGMELQFNRTHNPYSTSLWHSDGCCHPPPQGHLMLSLLLSYCIVEEEQRMLSGFGGSDSSNHPDSTYDFPNLREPLYISPDEDKLYISNDGTSKDVVNLDFTIPDGESVWKDAIKANNVWKWYADNKDKDKFGFIVSNYTRSNYTEGETPHIAIALKGGNNGVIEISFVVSYENFGLGLVWLDDNPVNLHEENCKNVWDTMMDTFYEKLIGYWDQPASVPSVSIMRKRLKEGESGFLHICLTPPNVQAMKGTSNKFKLLGVRVY